MGESVTGSQGRDLRGGEGSRGTRSTRSTSGSTCLDECPASMGCGTLKCCIEILGSVDHKKMTKEWQFRFSRLAATLGMLGYSFPDGTISCELAQRPSVLSAMTAEAMDLSRLATQPPDHPQA